MEYVIEKVRGQFELSSIGKVHVNISTGTTQTTNQVALPIVAPFLKRKNPIVITLFKPNNTGACTAVIESGAYTTVIENGYGIGYGGEGPNGLVALLSAFGISEKESKNIVYSNSLKNEYLKIKILN